MKKFLMIALSFSVLVGCDPRKSPTSAVPTQEPQKGRTVAPAAQATTNVDVGNVEDRRLDAAIAQPTLQPILPDGFEAKSVGTAQRHDHVLRLLVGEHTFAEVSDEYSGTCATPTGRVEREKGDTHVSDYTRDQTWWHFAGSPEVYVQFADEEVYAWYPSSREPCWSVTRLTPPDRYPTFATDDDSAESGPINVGGHEFDVEVLPSRVTIRFGGRAVASFGPKEIDAKCAYFRRGAQSHLVDFEVTFTDMAPEGSPTDCTDVGVDVENPRVRLDMATTPPRKVPPPTPAKGDTYRGIAPMGEGVMDWGGRKEEKVEDFTTNDALVQLCKQEAERAGAKMPPRLWTESHTARWTWLVNGVALATAETRTEVRTEGCDCLDCGE